MSKRFHVILMVAFQFINDIRKSLIDISNKFHRKYHEPKKKPKRGAKQKGEQKEEGQTGASPVRAAKVF